MEVHPVQTCLEQQSLVAAAAAAVTHAAANELAAAVFREHFSNVIPEPLMLMRRGNTNGSKGEVGVVVVLVGGWGGTFETGTFVPGQRKERRPYCVPG